MAKHVIILIPVYNDFASLQILVPALEAAVRNTTETGFSLLIVNDGSTNATSLPVTSVFDIELVNLRRNIGHQKAIAVGLSHIHENKKFDKVVIMDADGEDRPEDVLRLLKASDENEERIVFAKRKSRQNGLSFSIFYFLYKVLFRFLTGKKISYGNFMVIPKNQLNRLVYYSEIWNHLSAGVIKSGIPFIAVAADKGGRYADLSKMNFISLVLHGLGAISVFLELVASRLLILSFFLILFSSAIILVVLIIKSFTDLAIPGWASSILSSMIGILLQGFLLSLFTIFLFLSSQSQRKLIPAYHYKEYTSSIETILHA